MDLRSATLKGHFCRRSARHLFARPFLLVVTRNLRRGCSLNGCTDQYRVSSDPSIGTIRSNLSCKMAEVVALRAICFRENFVSSHPALFHRLILSPADNLNLLSINLPRHALHERIKNGEYISFTRKRQIFPGKAPI